MEQKLAFVKDQTHICLVPSPKNSTQPPGWDLGMNGTSVTALLDATQFMDDTNDNSHKKNRHA